MFWYGNGGGGMLLGVIAMFIFFAIIATVLVVIFTRRPSGEVVSHNSSPAMHIIEERLARGEITQQEFSDLKGVLMKK